MTEVILRRATELDVELTYEWRNHPKTRQYSINSEVILKNDHIEWFKKKIINPECLLLIAESSDSNRRPLGVLRYDFYENDGIVSIYISPEIHSQGIGTKILLAGSDYIKQNRPLINTLTAQILKENRASLRAFEKAGYKFFIDNKYQYNLRKV